MKNYVIVSTASPLPPSMVAVNQVPPDMTSIALSALAASSSSMSSSSSRDHPSPDRAHRGATGGDDDDDDDGIVVAPGLSPAYSTPREASAAYRSGMLTSDPNVASCQRRMRLAVRYLLLEGGGGRRSDGDRSRGGGEGSASAAVDGDDNDEEDDDLFMCWIDQDGSPHHFRRMRPLRCAVARAEHSTDVGVAGDANGPGGEIDASSNSPRQSAPQHPDAAVVLVNGNDHVEITFPGHAFVFCRKVDHRSSDVSSVESRNGRDPMSAVAVSHEGDATYFSRVVEKTFDGEGNGFVAIEKYLVVGGYRPGPLSRAMADGGDGKFRNSEEADVKGAGGEGGDSEVVESDGDDDGHESNAEECDDERDDERDDESDEDGCDEENLLHLVTILRAGKKDANGPPSQRENGIVVDKRESDTRGRSSPTSEAICCPGNCLPAVPFLRDVARKRARRAHAFVASRTDDDIGMDTTSPEEEDAGLSISVCLSRLDPTPLDTSDKHYDEVVLGGWPCRVEPGCFPPDMAPSPGGRNLLRMRFELDLMAASLCLPVDARSKLRRSTPVWINKSQSYGPRAAPVRARDACFHPGSGWLKRVGMSKAKCGGVEFFDAVHYLSDCDLWGAGGLVLHELSHAWHSKFVEDGYDNGEIKDVYDKAMEEGLYDSVRVRGPQGPMARAYACTNQMEYFAELSVAFLGGLDDDEEHNKWYPFNRSQLREHDPRAFAMLCRMWGLEIKEPES